MDRAGAQDRVQRLAFETTDGDQITELLRQQYVDNDIKFSSPTPTPLFSFATTETPELASDTLRSSIDYGGTCDPFDHYLFYVCRHGQLRVDSDAGQQRLRPGDPTFFPLGRSLDFDFHDMGLQTLKLPAGRLEQTAESITGVPAAQVRFDGLEPVSQPAQHRWNATFDFILHSLIEQPDTPPSALVTEQLAHVLVSTALDTFPNTTMNRHHERAAGHIDPAALRRATDYIDANARGPLTLAEIATAAGTTGRALQYAFRKHRDTTPLGYLRRVRLERAHRDLQNADPGRGDTVTAIAARWGFHDPGRFAVAYRDIYGQPPSTTLRT